MTSIYGSLYNEAKVGRTMQLNVGDYISGRSISIGKYLGENTINETQFHKIFDSLTLQIYYSHTIFGIVFWNRFGIAIPRSCGTTIEELLWHSFFTTRYDN